MQKGIFGALFKLRGYQNLRANVPAGSECMYVFMYNIAINFNRKSGLLQIL